MFIFLIVLMSNQFKNNLQKLARSKPKSTLKDLYNQSCYLLRHLRSENHPIFDNKHVKNQPVFTVKKKSESLDQIFRKSKTSSLIGSTVKHKKTDHLTKSKHDQSTLLYDSHHSQQSYLSSDQSDFAKNSFNKILTRACLMRNEKKRFKFLCLKNSKMRKSSQDKYQSNLVGKQKQIVPRQAHFENLCNQLKQRQQINQINKILYKRRGKKKCVEYNKQETLLLKSKELQKNIDPWDFEQQQLQSHRF